MAPSRDRTISLRADSGRRALIDRASTLLGKSRTEFVLEAACEKAHRVLLEGTTFPPDTAPFLRFAELLDAPLPTRAVKRLLARRAPWERRVVVR